MGLKTGPWKRAEIPKKENLQRIFLAKGGPVEIADDNVDKVDLRGFNSLNQKKQQVLVHDDSHRSNVILMCWNRRCLQKITYLCVQALTLHGYWET